MYDQSLKYIAISYRWGEMDEQLVKTPDYIAHITSFHLRSLAQLCHYIKQETDLKEIQYLWIDAISVDQLNNERKKDTILKMSEIYKRATYILAVPDLHYEYLRYNPANRYLLDLVEKYRKTIYVNILNNGVSANEDSTIDKEINVKNKPRQLLNYFINDRQSCDEYNNELDGKIEDIKKVYEFLAYLTQDWSNRAWVISEYQIAKEKEKSQGTPLKYIFVYLLFSEVTTFFSYSFDHQPTNINIHSHSDSSKDSNNDSNNKINYSQVDSSSKFINFLRTRFIQQNHLNMLLNSNATRNEDRFNAILSSWKKYNYLIKNKNTISNWNITDMISVRLKLYELMDDLWDKARLLYACSHFDIGLPILPSYASQCNGDYLYLNEKDKAGVAYEVYSAYVLSFGYKMYGSYDITRQILDNTKKEFGSIYTDNILTIQLDPNYYYLSIKSIKYFIIEMEEHIFDQRFLSNYSLKDDDSLKFIWIPFFTFTIPNFTEILPLKGSRIVLLGNMDQNKWILLSRYSLRGNYKEVICCSDKYSFNIY
ncbi:hypothetical protein BJ944DRAFT_14180 [Cunninghamella echinulata]|nr:hypothetical protein BJ944DRAFT_14180 [Cunninghamella echinulata]